MYSIPAKKWKTSKCSPFNFVLLTIFKNSQYCFIPEVLCCCFTEEVSLVWHATQLSLVSATWGGGVKKATEHREQGEKTGAIGLPWWATPTHTHTIEHNNNTEPLITSTNLFSVCEEQHESFVNLLHSLLRDLIGSFQFTTELTARSNYRHRRFPAHYWGALDFQTATPVGHLSSITPTAEGCSLCWQAQLLRPCQTKRSASGAGFHTWKSFVLWSSMSVSGSGIMKRHLKPELWNKGRNFFARATRETNTRACRTCVNALDFHTAAFERHFFHFSGGSWGMIVVHSGWLGYLMQHWGALVYFLCVCRA